MADFLLRDGLFEVNQRFGHLIIGMDGKGKRKAVKG